MLEQSFGAQAREVIESWAASVRARDIAGVLRSHVEPAALIAKTCGSPLVTMEHSRSRYFKAPALSMASPWPSPSDDCTSDGSISSFRGSEAWLSVVFQLGAMIVPGETIEVSTPAA
jgi:hypothetical protein